MKVETKPIEQKPEVVITLSWEEAELLISIIGKISGKGPVQHFMNEVYAGLRKLNVESDCSLRFSSWLADDG